MKEKGRQRCRPFTERWWDDVRDNLKLYGLQVFAGLMAAEARQVIQKTEWSWGNFFASWFIHTVAVVVLTVFAGAAILHFHKPILGYEYEGQKDKYTEVMYYVTITVIVFVLGIMLGAGSGSLDD
jgi:hypothetical protein